MAYPRTAAVLTETDADIHVRSMEVWKH